MRTTGRRPSPHWFADLKADALAWWVRTASEETLRWVMGGRLRRVLLWQIFRTIGQRACPDARVNKVVEFRITGRPDGGVDRYGLALRDGRCRASKRCPRAAGLTLELEAVSFLRLAGGTASPERLLLTRKLKLRGDLLFALALPATLRLPGRA